MLISYCVVWPKQGELRSLLLDLYNEYLCVIRNFPTYCAQLENSANVLCLIIKMRHYFVQIILAIYKEKVWVFEANSNN